MSILGIVALLEMVMPEDRLEHVFHSRLLQVVPPSHSYMHLIASSASGLEAGAIVLVMLHRPELLFAFVTLAREAGEHHWPKNCQA